MENADRNFFGTWDLMSWTIETKDGKVETPFGDNPVGQITYERNGLMNVLIMKNDRPAFSSTDPLEGRPEEVIAAYHGFIAYSGRYEVNVESMLVIHQIRISSVPNWIGQSQVRKYDFNGDLLTLSTGFIGSRKHQLVWKRMAKSDSLQ